MNKAQYQLYYWRIPFRGCFISYQFAYADEPLLMSNDFTDIRNLMAQPPAEQPIPFVGPPVLIELSTGRAINQMPAIVLYIAEKLNLKPQNAFETAMCTKVLMDCNDVLMEICCYNGSSMWQRENWINFRTERFPKWLRLFEESLNRGFIGREQVTFADIAVFALFGNMMRCLTELEVDIRHHAPNIYALCKKIGSQPSLKKKVESEAEQFGQTYCGGQIEESIRKMLAMDKQESEQ